jgi:hypothetical protein
VSRGIQPALLYTSCPTTIGIELRVLSLLGKLPLDNFAWIGRKLEILLSQLPEFTSMHFILKHIVRTPLVRKLFPLPGAKQKLPVEQVTNAGSQRLTAR